MQHLEIIAAKIPEVKKVMLTVFLSNDKAASFYKKLGYSKDEFSPPPKILRNGAHVEVEYAILSKSIIRSSAKRRRRNSGRPEGQEGRIIWRLEGWQTLATIFIFHLVTFMEELIEIHDIDIVDSSHRIVTAPSNFTWKDHYVHFGAGKLSLQHQSDFSPRAAYDIGNCIWI